nr:helix-turn-helix transcriptional regulator [Robbsia andropogonis]
MESAFRQAASNADLQSRVLEVTGWDRSMISKVISGGAGITLDKLDSVLEVLGLVITTPGYMDWLAQGNEIGANCKCARRGYGACGNRQ